MSSLPATGWKQLKLGMKLVFYQPHEDMGFVGEANKKRIMLSEDPMKFYETYSDRIFLTKNELKEYVKSQERGKSGWKSRGQQKKALDSNRTRKHQKTRQTR